MYQMKVYDGYDWVNFADFDPAILDLMIDSARAIAVNPTIGAESIIIMDAETGEILFCDIGVEDDPEPYGIDDDCGFDPYLGCYTDDC